MLDYTFPYLHSFTHRDFSLSENVHIPCYFAEGGNVPMSKAGHFRPAFDHVLTLSFLNPSVSSGTISNKSPTIP